MTLVSKSSALSSIRTILSSLYINSSGVQLWVVRSSSHAQEKGESSSANTVVLIRIWKTRKCLGDVMTDQGGHRLTEEWSSPKEQSLRLRVRCRHFIWEGIPRSKSERVRQEGGS